MTLPHRICAWCQTPLKMRVRRDIVRKWFCSRACRQRMRYAIGDIDIAKLIAAGQTPEANAKKVNRGPRNGRWLADRSKVKNRPRHELTIWRKAIFERDDYTCQTCGVRGGQLQADHIKPYALFPHLRWELSNGRTLCVPCHKATPTYGAGTRRMAKEMGRAA